eukprot:m.100162 g.100162  ORF g.100162 m.100162 type:complete len:71 (-) comp20651_c1_seq1:92-304(-)
MDSQQSDDVVFLLDNDAKHIGDALRTQHAAGFGQNGTGAHCLIRLTADQERVPTYFRTLERSRQTVFAQL